jgi:uncharacterized protein DUF4145
MSTDDQVESFHKQVVESKRKWISEAAKTPEALPPNKYIFCNRCEGETNHICKADYCRHYLAYTDRFLGGYTYTIGYRLWMCAGCEGCTLERYFTDETLENEDGIAEDETEFFPKRTENNHKSKHFRQLPTKLDDIYKEAVQASNNQMVILCGVGIRALIEGICADQKVAGKNLEVKINGLANILPKNIVTNLHSLRFIGNESAHELSAPLHEELQLALEICEDLLNYLYELDYKASYLNQVRERRKSSKNDSSASASKEP